MLVISCSDGGQTLLLRREDMSVIVASEQVSSNAEYESEALAIIEIGDFGDNVFEQ